ncbi:hypothetical protein MD484_g2482, partial [Candolleomyces efflorescens]
MPSPVASATRSGSVAPPKGRPSLFPSKSINPDLSAHPRTNPIGALSTLLKLLSSLSSRVGRCQYKLTPAEHALSLHLVSILDPYVYQGAKTLSTVVSAQTMPIISGLVYQPTEILDSIMSFLDSKRDLLNVALCCKHLHDVVFPRHFEYRFIRCKVSSLSVWNHLLVNHSLARNVRRLEIVDERSSASTMPRGMIVPRGITKRDTDLESTDDELGMHKKQERYLGLALQMMSGLKELKWSCNHSPISIEHIWSALSMRCTTLDTLEIADNLMFTSKSSEGNDAVGSSAGESDSEREEGSGPVSVLPMSTLTNAVFKSTRHNYGARKNPDMSRITEVLSRCPSLKNLQVTFVRPTRSQIGHLPLVNEFLEGRWSNLTGLSLSGVRCAQTTSLEDFLSEHRQLESLHLDVSGVYSANFHLRPDSLPRLRELTSTKVVINAILGCSLSNGESTLRPIETVKGFNLSGMLAIGDGKHVDTELLHNLKKHSSTLHRVELGGWHDMDDIKKLASSLPGLTYLDLGKRLNVNTNRDRGGVVGPVTNFEEWLEVLLTLPELRALHGVKFFYEISTHNIPNSSSVGNPASLSTTSTSSPGTLHAQQTAGTIPGDSVVAAKIQSQMSLMDRSRMKKNDWTASMLVWRCPKLRRVDYWEDGTSRIIVLTRGPGSSASVGGGASGDQAVEGEMGTVRESSKVRWEVRRLKAV